MLTDVEKRGRESLEVVFVLLCLQTGVGLLAALGALVFAAASRSPVLLGLPLLVALAVPAVEIGLGIALLRLHRWARTALIVLESLFALVTLFRLALHAAPGLGLAGICMGLLVPIAINAMVLGRSARIALRRPQVESVAATLRAA